MSVESLPSGWTRESLASLASDVTSGATPQSGNPRYYTQTGGFPFAKIDDLTAATGRHLTETFLRVTPAALRDTALSLYPPGTILLSMYGTVGLVRTTVRETTANQALAALLPPFACDLDYLAHSLIWSRPRWEKYKSQTTQANINGRTVKAFECAVPPLPEQRRIAEILDTLDEAIRKTEQVIRKLQQMKQGLLHDLLIRGIDEHGELRDPERHPEQFKDSPLGRIPRGWKVVRFGECLSESPQNGLYKASSYYGANGTPIVRIDGFYDGVLAPVSSMKRLRLVAQELKTYRLEEGNILINRVNSIDFVGKAALVPQIPEPVVFESNMMRCRLVAERLDPKFAIRWLTGSHARRWFHRRAKSAIAQASVNQGDVTSLRVVVPSPDEQRQAVATIEGAAERIEKEQRQLDKLRTLKQGLMDDLLTGRVRVRVPPETAP